MDFKYNTNKKTTGCVGSELVEKNEKNLFCQTTTKERHPTGVFLLCDGEITKEDFRSEGSLSKQER